MPAKKLYTAEEYRIRKNAQEYARRQVNREAYLEGKKRHYEKAKIKDGFKEKMAASAKVRYDEHIEYVRNIKITNGCNICGYKKYASALLFHHLDKEDKSFDVSSCYTRSLDSIKSEIGKCEILCQNCHFDLHFNEDWELTYLRQSKFKRIKRKKYCNSYSSLKGCKNCGDDNYRHLHFHHRDPEHKVTEVSYLCSISDKKLMEEISKCDILCANCHLELHHE